ncbi:MAG: acyltransferase [Rhodobacterales bacterium]|nr:acyltransferase [Rhodobacterales bacterium]
MLTRDNGLNQSNAMSRNGTLDYARLIAAFGIVFFHAHAPGAAIGYAALPFFLILLVVMSVPAARRMPFGPFAGGRAQRLLTPWLIWSGIYGALKLTEIVATGASFASEFAPYMMLTGPALHLWFLPFALVVCVVAYPAVRRASWPLSVALTATGLTFMLVQQGLTLPIPFAQWLYGMPAVCLGLALAIGKERIVQQVLLLCGFVTGALIMGATGGLAQLSMAAVAFILCCALPLHSTATSRLAGAAALDVYLAHPLVLSVLERTTTIVPNSLTMALLGCGGALMISLSIIRCKNVHRNVRLRRLGRSS